MRTEKWFINRIGKYVKTDTDWFIVKDINHALHLFSYSQNYLGWKFSAMENPFYREPEFPESFGCEIDLG